MTDEAIDNFLTGRGSSSFDNIDHLKFEDHISKYLNPYLVNIQFMNI